MLHPKKVGTLPVKGSDEEKQTNEIKIAAPMLDTIEIAGRIITADALLTQRDLARYLVDERGANYHFTVKGNQSLLLEAIVFYFQSNPSVADFTQAGNGEHGRIETRKIWVTTKLNHYLDFPHVGQAFMVKRESSDKKGGNQSRGRLWHHQYTGGPSKPGTDSCRQPRALACGKLPLHH